MMNFAKSSLCGAYKYSGAMCVQEALLQRFGRPFMSVLLFHRVTDAVPEDSLTVSTRRFREMCRMLHRGFNVVPLAKVFHILKTNAPVPPRTVAVTFDDCYRDNLQAARVLAGFGLSACFFIPTSFLETETVFEWDKDLPRLPNLTWDEVREMAEMGHEIGSHTVTHADLATISIEQMRCELALSKEILQDKLNRQVRWLAYPFGGKEHFRLDRLPLVYEAGYEGCLSGHGRFVYPHLNEPIMPRVPVPDFQSTLHLESYLTGSLQWLYALKELMGFGQQDRQRKQPLTMPIDELNHHTRGEAVQPGPINEHHHVESIACKRAVQ
jgi:peptidoglycan/xylan/chitin deacetylase (PgdA/CDA1 family)